MGCDNKIILTHERVNHKKFEKRNIKNITRQRTGICYKILDTESEEYADVKKAMKELEELQYQPLSSYIFRTLIYLGPILSLIINYVGKNYDSFKFGIPLGLLSTVLLTLLWRDYLYKRKQNKKLQKTRMKKKDIEIHTWK